MLLFIPQSRSSCYTTLATTLLTLQHTAACNWCVETIMRVHRCRHRRRPSIGQLCATTCTHRACINYKISYIIIIADAVIVVFPYIYIYMSIIIRLCCIKIRAHCHWFFFELGHRPPTDTRYYNIMIQGKFFSCATAALKLNAIRAAVISVTRISSAMTLCRRRTAPYAIII